MARLKLTSGDQSVERELPADGAPLTLGRAEDNTWPLDDQAASRRHAQIAFTAEGYVLQDLGSSNGTWVNRSRVERHVLVDGDEITIGGSTLVFTEPATNEATVLVDMADLPDRPAPPPEKPKAAPPPPAPPKSPPPPAPERTPSEPAPAAPQPAPPAAAAAPVAPAIRRSSAARVAPSGAADWKAKVEALLGAYTAWLAQTPDPPRPEAGQPAGFAPRLGAYLVDAVIAFVLTFAVMLPFTLLGALIGSRVAFLAALLSLVGWLLGMAVSIAYLLIPWAQVGVTPGKRLLGLRIVRGDGVEPLGYGKAAVRMVGYMVSGLVFCAGFIMIAFTKENRGLHDMIADTKVVRS